MNQLAELVSRLCSIGHPVLSLTPHDLLDSPVEVVVLSPKLKLHLSQASDGLVDDGGAWHELIRCELLR